MDNISIERIWQDYDFFEIRVTAQSAQINANTVLYITDSEITTLSTMLRSFLPTGMDTEVYWEVCERGIGKSLSLRIFPKDSLGHVMIEVYMLIKDGDPNNWNEAHHCCFYVQTEIGLLNTFGKRLPSVNKPHLGMKISLLEDWD